MSAFADTARRVAMMVARGIVRAVNDAPKLQSLQIDLLADETSDNVEHFQTYGLTSVPHAEAEAIVIFPGGTRSHGIVIAVDDRRYRLRGLAGGEVALYDDQWQVIHLKRDCLLIKSDFKVTVEAPEVTVTADAVNLGGSGGMGVARIGDAVVDGVITAGSNKVKSI